MQFSPFQLYTQGLELQKKQVWMFEMTPVGVFARNPPPLGAPQRASLSSSEK
jgi:hypothetical protein